MSSEYSVLFCCTKRSRSSGSSISWIWLKNTALIAAWMLYIQHQYEDTYYRAPGEWRFELAALQGSSYLRLPRPLAWMVGNANYHHVHHLSAKIPNYRLRAAHESHAMFRCTPIVTLRSSIRTFRLKLWDTESQRLVPFPKLSRRDRVAALGEAAVLGGRQRVAPDQLGS